MADSSSRRVGLFAVALVVFSCALILALHLLCISKLSGGEFTAFVLSFAVLCIAVGFAPEIQKISIAGNVVELREIKSEAIETIESLKRFRIENIRSLLMLATKNTSSFANEKPIDPRNKEFCRIVALAKDYGCQQDLKEDILSGIDTLLRGQLWAIEKRNSSVSRTEILSPIQLAPKALSEEGIKDSASKRFPLREVSYYENEIRIALEEYERLYSIRKSIELLV